MSVTKYLDSLEDLSNKKILITGGTAGIGLSIIHHLLYKHASVVVLARNENKYNNAKKSLLEEYPNADISFIKYDQSDDQSVINAANNIIKNHADFYALILNAGLMQRNKHATKTDGYSTTIKTNFIGVSLLLKNLVPYLKEGQRVIFQGSLGAGLCFGRIKTLKEENPKLFRSYFLSKACIEALFYYYSKQEKLAPSFYLVEPGITKSDIIRDFVPIIRFLGKIVLTLFSHTADKAALTAMKALDSDMEKGSYLVPRGLCTYRGFPKRKTFPKSRRREYLIEMLDDKYK